MVRPFPRRAAYVAAVAMIAAAPLGWPLLSTEVGGPQTVRLEPRPFAHRLDGEWRREGREIDAPLATVSIAAPIDMMAFPVSVGDYMQCVGAGACAAPLAPTHDASLPVTGVSWTDANDYAAWVSARTGAVWRLPTDAEWAQGAGSLFVDDALGIADDPTNPASRWLARYEAETKRAQEADRSLRPVGSVNRSETGIHDVAGAVWEWTSTCLRRVEVDSAGLVKAEDENCGIYIAQGRHRAPLIEFVRNPKSGGCSVGAAPDHLGFRLVRERSVPILAWLLS